MIISLLVVAALSHVPHYPGHPTLNYDCKNKCCKLGYKGDVSQVSGVDPKTFFCVPKLTQKVPKRLSI